MKGLLLKDFMNLQRIGKQYLVIFLGMTVVAAAMKNPSFLSMFIILCGSMALLSSFSFDEYTRFDLYVLALPVSRKDVVKEKYVLMLILMIVPVAAGTAVSMIIYQLTGLGDRMELICFCIGMGIGLSMAYAIMIPFIFKMGVEKARIIMVVSYIVVFGTVLLLAKVILGMSWIQTTLSETMQGLLLLGMLLVIAAVFFLISYNVSKAVMMKKEF